MKIVIKFRNGLIQEYGTFFRRFTRIAAPDILAKVDHQYAKRRYWPDPLIQINPNYQRKKTVRKLAQQGLIQLRALLDACYPWLYGLTHEELSYILEPADVRRPDYQRLSGCSKTKKKKSSANTAPSVRCWVSGTLWNTANSEKEKP